MNSLKVIFVLSALVAVTIATSCYVCDSTVDTCSDEYSGAADHEIDCESDISYTEDGGCSKTKSQAKVFGIKAVTVSRTCGQLYDNSACAQQDRQKIKVLTVSSEVWSCSCSGELCNGAINTNAGFMVLFAIAGIAKLIL